WRVAARGDLRVRRDKAEENEALECKQSNRGQATGIRVPSMGDHACSPAQIGVSPCAGKMRCQPDGDNTQFGGVVITFKMAPRCGACWFEFFPSSGCWCSWRWTILDSHQLIETGRVSSEFPTNCGHTRTGIMTGQFRIVLASRLASSSTPKIPWAVRVLATVV